MQKIWDKNGVLLVITNIETIIFKESEMKTSKKNPNWVLGKDEITDIVLPNMSRFHLVLTDQMFQRVAKFAKSDDGVAFYVSSIIQAGITILRKITQRNYNWKVFQHLKPEIEDENTSEVIMTKHNSKTKVRKHEEHHLLIQIPYPIFNEIKRQHARINTFSMALLSRIIIELFLSIYEECTDYDKAIKKMHEVILALHDGKDFEKCDASFKIYMEVDKNNDDESRAVVFFVVNLKSNKLGVDFYFKLRL